MRVRIVIAESPNEIEKRINDSLKQLERGGHTVQDVRVDTAGTKRTFYATITYAEDIS